MVSYWNVEGELQQGSECIFNGSQYCNEVISSLGCCSKLIINKL